jgi:hypothetical protein
MLIKTVVSLSLFTMAFMNVADGLPTISGTDHTKLEIFVAAVAYIIWEECRIYMSAGSPWS